MDQVTRTLAGGEQGNEQKRSSGRTRSVLVTMTRLDMDWVMAQPKPKRSKLLFIIIAHNKPHCNRISQTRLAKMIGTTEETVKRTLAEMAREGVIEVYEARPQMTEDGNFYRLPNAYFPVEESTRHVADDRSGMGVEIDICKLGEAFDEVFYAVIDKLFTAKEILDLLRPKEISEYVLWLDRQRTRKEAGIG